ncbi:MAG TPA: cytochrome c oxidase subunit II [Microbacteriaceae bacterium]|nr:cytochrome c oxidase subunit II [Microbacteriaceae bacterium]
MRSNRRLRWAVVPVAVTLIVILAGCSQQQLRGFLPGDPGVTNHTDGITGLWVTSWIVLLVVGIITWGLIIWAAIVYRRRKGQTGIPVQLRYNLPIEIFYTIVPLILVLGFFAFTAKEQNSIEHPVTNSDVKIEVYAKRWAWDFNYTDVGPGNKGVYSPGVQAQQIENTDGSIDRSKLPVLYLPLNKTVQIKLESRDVNHSFWVPDFLYKKDNIPGKDNYMFFTPTKLGTYEGKCAELCGDYHSLMLFEVKVVTPDEYDSYIQSLADKGQTGILGPEYNTNTNQPDNKAPQADK